MDATPLEGLERASIAGNLRGKLQGADKRQNHLIASIGRMAEGLGVKRSYGTGKSRASKEKKLERQEKTMSNIW